MLAIEGKNKKNNNLEAEKMKARLYLVVIVPLMLGFFVSNASAQLDLAGEWDSTYKPSGEMATYTIVQTPGSSTFSWTIHHSKIPEEKVRKGKITGNKLEIEYNRPRGPHATGDRWVKVTGTIVKRDGERATKIQWANGVDWYR